MGSFSKTTCNKLSCRLLVLYPILNIYTSFLPHISWGAFFFFLLILGDFSNNGKLERLFVWPQKYLLCWVYLFVTYIIIANFKPASFIPGGLGFFLFSIILGYALAHFDYDLFKKDYRRVVVGCCVFFYLQEIMYYFLGYRFHLILPFFDLLDGASKTELISSIVNGLRSPSFFREPAHFATFLLPILAMELFDKDGKNVMFTKFSILIGITLLALMSGNGIIGLMFLFSVKLVYYIIKSNVKHKIVKLLFSLSVLFLSFSYYILTDSGGWLVNRSTELEYNENSNSYIRIYRGYALYGELPTRNKLIGSDAEELMRIIPHTSISYLFSGDAINDLYCNGIQYLLIFSGFIGFLLFMVLYFELCEKTSILGLSLILLLLVVSLISQTFLSNIMLFSICIATTERKRMKMTRLK